MQYKICFYLYTKDRDCIIIWRLYYNDKTVSSNPPLNPLRICSGYLLNSIIFSGGNT